MLAEAIRRADNEARESWTYLADPPGHDTWVSHAEEAAAKTDWADDCDGLTITALQLCHAAPLAQRYILLVRTTEATTPAPDHMVGAAMDDQGVLWIVGDTVGPAYRCEACAYSPGYYWRLDERGPDEKPVWREGFPWT